MAKTNAEKCRTYYLKNKQRLKAKAKERAKVKYDQLHQGRYYNVVGLTTWKELWEEIEYQINSGEFQKKLNKRKPLSEREINNLKLVACAIFNEMEDKCWYEPAKLFSSVIQKKANGINSKLLQAFYSFVSNDNGFQIRRTRNPFYLSIARDKKEIVKNGQTVANVWVRSAKPTKLLKDSELIPLSVEMTENCYKNWKLLTSKEIKEKRDQVANYKYDNYTVYKPASEYVVNGRVVDAENRFYHSQFTASELEDIQNYKKLRVDVGLLDKLIREKLKQAMQMKQTIVDTKELEAILNGGETGKKKMIVDYKTMLQLSDLLTKLTPKTGLKITFSYGRLYFPIFTSIDSQFRYLFHRKQIFDAPTCFSTLNMIQYRFSKYRNEEELKKLYSEIIEKDIYIMFAHRLGIGREQVKPLLNKWYFATKGGRNSLKGLLKEINFIDEIMQEEFPTFYKFIVNGEDITTVKGKKNVLSVTNQWTEGGLVLNKLYRELESKTKNTVHDAIYVDEQEYNEQLEEQMKTNWFELVKNIIFDKGE